jgi:tetratricopeptide (TPR) repeat protein
MVGQRGRWLRNTLSERSNSRAGRLSSRSMKRSRREVGVAASWLAVLAALGCGASAERGTIQKSATSGRAALVAKRAAPGLADLDAACREPSCVCVSGGGRALLDADLGKEALALLDAAPRLCGQPHAGMRAEALVRSADAAGPAAARAAITADSQDPFAHQALALLAYREGRFSDAIGEVALARSARRGSAALLLQGSVSFAQGDLGAAERDFAELVRLSPADLVARYDLALVEQKMGRVRDAREGYLAVLADDPKNLDARFNLGVLMWQAGSPAEARHQWDKLREVAPKGTDLVSRLEQMLNGAPPPPARSDAVGLPPQGPAGQTQTSVGKMITVTKTAGPTPQGAPLAASPFGSAVAPPPFAPTK